MFDIDPKLLTTLATAIVGVTMGIVTAGKILLYMLQRQFSAALEAIERIPEPSWFVGVDESLKRIPSQKQIERIDRHLEKGHEHSSVLTQHNFALESIQGRMADHEIRLRALEVRQNQR